jgi:hypothetical protein
MIAIDGRHNSWRHLVLPLACQGDDRLTMDAILCVSAFHVDLWRQPTSAQNQDVDNCRELMRHFDKDPQALYTSILSRLHQYSDINSYDATKRQTIMITILVLVVGAMVTAQSDFYLLYRMLDAAVEAIGGTRGLGNNDVARFIQSQLDKYVDNFHVCSIVEEQN